SSLISATRSRQAGLLQWPPAIPQSDFMSFSAIGTEPSNSRLINSRIKCGVRFLDATGTEKEITRSKESRWHWKHSHDDWFSDRLRDWCCGR
ncbi:hypothetical protein AB9U18_25355, partial [Novosphingobium sp. NRRL B-2648]|uniref:hypothetical protein n=1 Tax=Novosphingobium sp. NRRL B-2648 TaxID=3230802 RepID=UPI003510E0AC